MMDLANREIIAYQIGWRQSFGLVSKTLKETLSKRASEAVSMIHSDQKVTFLKWQCDMKCLCIKRANRRRFRA